MRILVVEDDRELADILRRGLREQSYSVEVAYDGATARHLALSEPFDLILLDLMVPKVTGLVICQAIRCAGKTTPIIVVTARDQVEDRVLGLDAGADDYMVKPFSMSELFARIRAVMRRPERSARVLRVGALSLDPRSNYVKVGPRKVTLTPKEFALLQYFMLHPDVILSRTEILENVWDSNYDGPSNVIDVYINYLRNKIEKDGEVRCIETIRGRGYMLNGATNANQHHA